MNHNIRDRDDFYEKLFNYFGQLADHKNNLGVFSETITIITRLLESYIDSTISNNDEQKQFLVVLVKKIKVDTNSHESNKDVLYNISKYIEKIKDTIQNKETAPMTVVRNTKPGVEFVFGQSSVLTKIGDSEQYSAYLNTIFPESKSKEIVYFGTNSILDYFSRRITESSRIQGSIGTGFYFNPKSQRHNSTFLIAAILDTTHLWRNFRATIFEFGDKIETNGKWSGEIAINKEELDRKDDDSDAFIKRVKSEIRKKINESFIMSSKDLSDIFTKVMISLDCDSVTYSSMFGGEEILVFELKQIHILGSKKDIEKFKAFRDAQKKSNIQISLTG